MEKKLDVRTLLYEDDDITVEDLGNGLLKITDTSELRPFTWICHVSSFISGCAWDTDACPVCESKPRDDITPCPFVETTCWRCLNESTIAKFDSDGSCIPQHELDAATYMRQRSKLPVEICCCGLSNLHITVSNFSDGLDGAPVRFDKDRYQFEVCHYRSTRFLYIVEFKVTSTGYSGNESQVTFKFSADGTGKPSVVVEGDTSESWYTDLLRTLHERTGLSWDSVQ
jgi:hypothetical protein